MHNPDYRQITHISQTKHNTPDYLANHGTLLTLADTEIL